MFGLKFQEIHSLRVRLHGVLFTVVNDPLHGKTVFSEYDQYFRRKISHGQYPRIHQKDHMQRP